MSDMTPGSWLTLLERRLDERRRTLQTYEDYYSGKHRLTFATAKFREAFGSLFGALADNWCELVVSASVERLKVQGFRFGEDQSADADAWRIWQENGLDAESDMAHTEAVKLCEAFWLVQPPLPDASIPRITAEHPSQMILARAPGSRRNRLAALKKWLEPDGHAMATLYLPEQIVKYRSEKKVRALSSVGSRIVWVRRADDPGGPNPLGEVPVIALPNNPTLLGGGQSDLRNVIPLQDAINKLLSDLIVGSEFQAFPQRVMMGVEIPKDENGQPLPSAELKAIQSRVWALASKDARIGEFSAASLDNYTNGIAMLVQHLSAQTRTPPHYLIGQIVNASGDALKAAETGLVAKVEGKKTPFGEGHEDAMRLAFKSVGNEKANATGAETIWRDSESRSFGELVDGLTKLASIGVPQEILWEQAGYTPQQISRMKTLKVTDDLLLPPPPDARVA